jgi:hypothetical protein
VEQEHRGGRAHRLGKASAVIRSPGARLPIWSWFWRKPTKAVGGKSAHGSPRATRRYIDRFEALGRQR